jgi:hypothetical protein
VEEYISQANGKGMFVQLILGNVSILKQLPLPGTGSFTVTA